MNYTGNYIASGTPPDVEMEVYCPVCGASAKHIIEIKKSNFACDTTYVCRLCWTKGGEEFQSINLKY